MQKLTFRLRVAVLFLFCVISPEIIAQADTVHHTNGSAALQACQAAASQCVAQRLAAQPGTNWGANACVEQNYSSDYSKQVYFASININGSYQYSTYSQCGIPAIHTFPDGVYDPPCEDPEFAEITHWASATLPNPIPTASICQNSCVYIEQPGSISQDCVYQDNNSNGVADDGDDYQCPATYVNGGGSCSDGNQANTSSSPNYFDCTNVDCSSDSDPGGGTGTNDDGGTTPGQDTGSNTNPSPGTGDGDVDTPTTGTGDGDVDGDGNRDIDCDPSSNPDCGYTGSGTGSGNCDVQPSCSGDPVQCAILYQEWASMCYDGATLDNPENCNASLVCEGDKLKCEIIRQQRQQYCDLYYGDGSQDMDVFNDTDFTDDPLGDLRAETTPTSIMDLVDITPASGTCPAGIDTSVYGVAIQFSLQPFCDLAPFIRALVLISAWLSAVMMVIGLERK